MKKNYYKEFETLDDYITSNIENAKKKLKQISKHRMQCFLIYSAIASFFFVIISGSFVIQDDISGFRKFLGVALIGGVTYGGAISLTLKQSWESLARSMDPLKHQRSSDFKYGKIGCIVKIAESSMGRSRNADEMNAYIKICQKMKLPDIRKNNLHNDLMDCIVWRAKERLEEP
jgi:hypothetical protein